MWVVTRSEWPQLVNLTRAANIGYQQLTKFDPRTRIVASAWEQEYVLAECGDGEEARALVEQIALALQTQASVLDLRDTVPARTSPEQPTAR
jgi:hypothetical protein